MSEALRHVTLLCVQVLRALQACFQADSGAFVTPEVFRRVLPPLVSQLKGGPSGEVQASLAADVALGEAAAAGGRESAAGNAYAQTAVAALIGLAASTGNDELWKPFNHQVPLHNIQCSWQSVASLCGSAWASQFSYNDDAHGSGPNAWPRYGLASKTVPACAFSQMYCVCLSPTHRCGLHCSNSALARQA